MTATRATESLPGRVSSWWGTALSGAPALAVALLALLGPWVSSGDSNRVAGTPYTPPGDGLVLGTDHLGRDVLPLLLEGGRSVLFVPLLGTALTCLLGTALGILAGYLRGIWDRAITGTSTLLLSGPPTMLVMMLLVVGWGASDLLLGIAVVLSGTPFVTRLIRSTTQRLTEAAYVEMAPAFGAGPFAVMATEILPGVLVPLLVDAGMRFVSAVYLVSAAAFLGLSTDSANWGAMVRNNLEGLPLNPWPVVTPALLLATLTVAANLLMDHLAKRLAT